MPVVEALRMCMVSVFGLTLSRSSRAAVSKPAARTGARARHVMKVAVAAAIVAAFSIGVAATPAAARHLSPSGSFTADGKVTNTKNGVTGAPCTAHFTGTVDGAGIGHFTGGSFEGTADSDCDKLMPANLPWKMVAATRRKAKVLNVTIEALGAMYCGPGTVPVTLKNGVISFTAVPLAGKCSISGHLTTSPSLAIVRH
jgi:hypothetical protein